MSTASCKIIIVASGTPGANITLAPSFTGVNSGRYDLPDGSGGPTGPSGPNVPIDIEIPFGSVTEATLVYILNMSGQELEVQVNGQPLNDNLPDAAAIVHASAGVPLAQPLESVTLTTTDAVSGAGKYVEYIVLGDPVA